MKCWYQSTNTSTVQLRANWECIHYFKALMKTQIMNKFQETQHHMPTIKARFCSLTDLC